MRVTERAGETVAGSSPLVEAQDWTPASVLQAAHDIVETLRREAGRGNEGETYVVVSRTVLDALSEHNAIARADPD